MTSDYLPLFKVQVNSQSSLELLSEVFDSGYINEGTQVGLLEKKLSNYLNVRNLTLVNSGTSSITLALKCAGVGMNDEVITTAMTCIASNTPIINLGAKIVWADIDVNTGIISPIEVEKKITSKTKAIILVDWAGNPADLDEFEKISKKYGIPVIQDAAHAFGATYRGDSIAKFTDFTCFSFQAIKHFTTGDGGALVCRKDKDSILARRLKWFGYDRDSVKDSKGDWRGQKWDADILANEVGYKFNLNNVAAAIGLANLSLIDKSLVRHRENARFFESVFANHSKISLLKIPDFAESSYWVFTLRLTVEAAERDTILRNLNAKGIGAGLVHLPNDNYSAFSEFRTELPATRMFADSQISLPCGWWINDSQREYIANTLLTELN